MGKRLYFTREEFGDLMSRTSPAGILSIYLDVDPPIPHGGKKRQTMLKKGLDELVEQTGSRSLARLAEQAYEEITLLSPETRHRSLVYYRSADPSWTWWRSLQVPVGTQFVWMEKAFVRPLVAVLDSAPTIGVAVVSQEAIRLLTWRQGVIVEEDEIRLELETEGWRRYAGPAPPVPGLRRQTATHTESFERRREAGLQHQLGEAARQMGATGDELGWRGLAIIGAPSPAADFVESLSEGWRRRLVGTLDQNLFKSSVVDISDRVSSLVAGWSRRRQAGELAEVLEACGAGVGAVAGPEDCLAALQEHRVKHLFFDSGLSLSGYRKSGGGYVLTPPPGDAGGLEPEPYLIERMIGMAFETGVEVTPVEDELTGRLRRLGGLAARLRY